MFIGYRGVLLARFARSPSRGRRGRRRPRKVFGSCRRCRSSTIAISGVAYSALPLG